MSPRFMLLSAASDARVRCEGDARVVQRGSAVRAARPPRARVGKRSTLLETEEHAVFMVTLAALHRTISSSVRCECGTGVAAAINVAKELTGEL
jgi:hypothetical protein